MMNLKQRERADYRKMVFVFTRTFFGHYLFHDLFVKLLIPLYVNIYSVYSLSYINFGGLSSFLT